MRRKLKGKDLREEREPAILILKGEHSRQKEQSMQMP